jgi:ribose transport system substrate-binding protein
MRIVFIFIVSICCLITFVFSLHYAYRVYQSNIAEQMEAKVVDPNKTRIVMITQELESPFSKALESGAAQIASRHSIGVDVWGTYHPNLNEILKYMDIAIASKVDGIIVQAMDGSDFIQKVQTATEKGIPVITVGLDAPLSLRKTYVGPNHNYEGELIGAKVSERMKGEGMVCIVSGNKLTSFESLRLAGVEKMLSKFPGIKVIKVEASDNELNQSKQLVNRILNQYPGVKVFVGLNAEAGIGIEQALRERVRMKEFSLYAFDDTPELRDMVDTDRITATLTNDGAVIGERSVLLIQQWINNISLPLKMNEYTPVAFYQKKGNP